MHSASSRTTPTTAALRVPFLQLRITNPPFDQTSISQQPLAPGAILRCHPLAACTENPPLCPHPCITPTVSLLSIPRRSNSPSTRCRTAACTRSTMSRDVFLTALSTAQKGGKPAPILRDPRFLRRYFKQTHLRYVLVRFKEIPPALGQAIRQWPMSLINEDAGEAVSL